MPTVQVQPGAEELLQEVANCVFKSRKTLVVTGAGISTNSGIPDFRSENGLYSLIQAQFDAANDLSTADCRSHSESFPEDGTHRDKRRKHSDDANGETQGDDGEADLGTDISSRGPTAKGEHPLKQMLHVSEVNESPRQELDPMPEAASRRPEQYSSPFVRIENDRTDAPAHGPAQTPRRTCRASSLPPDHQVSQHPMRPPSPRRTSQNYNQKIQGSVAAPAPLRRSRSASPARISQALPGRAPAHHHSSAEVTMASTTPKRVLDLPFSSSPLSSPPLSGVQPTPLYRHLKGADMHTPSRLTNSALAFSSSPLSSPPPILFDPFGQPSSSTSRQDSSDVGSTTSSDSDDSRPSFVPSLIPQTSNPNRSSLPNLKGRDLFDVSIWADPLRTSVFYTFITSLRQKVRDVTPTPSHLFISHLRNRGKLVRCYTQNIDQIEEKVGLSTSLQQGPGSRGRFSRKSTGGNSTNTTEVKADGTSKGPITLRKETSNGVECVFLHGSLNSLRCFLCGKICEWDDGGRSLETLSGRQPECPHCVGATAAREEKGKRKLGVGKLRPDIVLYGEEHPNAHLIDPIVKHDLALYPDFLLILGTSLKVHGLKVLVREFAKAVHCRGGKVVFVNYTKPPDSIWGDIIDYWVQWDCDAWVSDLRDRIPLLWLPPGTKLPPANKRKRDNSGDARPTKKREGMASKAGVYSSTEQQTNTTEPQGSPISVEVKPTPETETVASTITVSPNGLDAATKAKARKSEPTKPVSAPKAPVRPKCTREDKLNGAFLSWQIVRDLRRASGNSTELQMFSTPPRTYLPTPPSSAPAATSTPSRVSKPKGPKVRKHAGNSSQLRKSLPSTTEIEADVSAEPSPSIEEPTRPKKNASKPTRKKEWWYYVPDNAPEAMAMVAKQEERSFVFDTVASTDQEEQSLLAAIKSNPRRRKRKMVDGVEVGLPSSSPRRAPSEMQPDMQDEIHATYTPTPMASPTSTQKQEPCEVASPADQPKSTTQTLPPMHPDSSQQPAGNRTGPSKPAAARGPYSRPLATIAPNIAASQMHPYHAPHPMGDVAFAYFDALALKLRQPSVFGWTPDDQLKGENDAALGLDQLKTKS